MAKQDKQEHTKDEATEAVSDGVAEQTEAHAATATQPSDGVELDNATPEQLRQLLEQERQKSNEYLEDYRRARADFVNLKRRTDNERNSISLEARERLLLRILPIVDDFQRAISNVPENLKNEPWVNGVNLIESKFKKLLDQEGVTEIPAQDTEFNPHLHEGVYRDEDAQGERDWVTEVYQKGYKMGDKVIRHAMVKVGRK